MEKKNKKLVLNKNTTKNLKINSDIKAGNVSVDQSKSAPVMTAPTWNCTGVCLSLSIMVGNSK